ncbi:MAG: hypothetical protein WC740_20500, partial [Verrucomicrobiia bacterium]
DRGCKHIVLDTRMLLGKPAANVRVTARDEAGRVTAASSEPLSDQRLKFSATSAVDYVLH